MKMIEWRVVGTSENFTVLGLGEDNKIYFFKEGEWRSL